MVPMSTERFPVAARLLVRKHRGPHLVGIEVVAARVEKRRRIGRHHRRDEALAHQRALPVPAVGFESLAHHAPAFANHVGHDRDEARAHLAEVDMSIADRRAYRHSLLTDFKYLHGTRASGISIGLGLMQAATPSIDEALACALVRSQFPRWAHLPMRRVARDGWDNRSFRLGDEMVVRLPSAEAYAAQVEKEHRWLPVLAAVLSHPIPTPMAMGRPGEGYPWPWSVYRWVEGDSVEPAAVAQSAAFAADVAAFLARLQRVDAREGPPPGKHNFFRGGSLSIYESEVREAVRRLQGRIDGASVMGLWESAARTSWDRAPVWVHGDVSSGNLLSRRRRLAGVLDFGSLAVGDPACDLSIAWTVFRGAAREAFQRKLQLDAPTWLRARAWALWKGLIVAAGLSETNAAEWVEPLGVIDQILDAP
jgi:aminoglycoside phosphotransferase (APT) family kinase protein